MTIDKKEFIMKQIAELEEDIDNRDRTWRIIFVQSTRLGKLKNELYELNKNN